MKKFLTVLLAVIMVFSISAIDAFATDTSKEVNISYEVGQSFTWSVPTNAITASTSGASLEVSVSDNVIESGKKLEISVASGNSYKLKCGNDEIAYEIKSGTAPSETTWGANTVILSVNAGTASSAITGTVKVTGTATKAGTYTDKLTFTAAINDQN